MMVVQLETHMQRSRSSPFFISHAKINSKLTLDLKVKSKAIKLIEENKGDTFVTMI